MKIYGIRNCDTMKKALAWLDAQGVACTFVDYKEAGVAAGRLPHWLAEAGWETLLNRRGLTWKKLSDQERADLDAAKAERLMAQYPTLIRRPVVEHGDVVVVGFDAETWTRIFTR